MPPAPGIVLGHDCLLAAQLLADVAGDHAAPEVQGAAGPGADDHLHVLAGETWRLRHGRCGHGCKRDDGNNPHRPRRIALRYRHSRHRRQRGHARGQMQKSPTAAKFHGALP
jgi:hypothetical protein